MIIIIFMSPIRNRCHSIQFNNFCLNQLKFYGQENDNAKLFHLELCTSLRSSFRSTKFFTKEIAFFYERMTSLNVGALCKLNKNRAANERISD